MNKIIRIGIDTSKSVFVLHGVNAAEQPVLRRKLRRGQVLEFFAKLEPTKIGIEACGAAHQWARELTALGHEAVLLPPQYVKPYVKRNKNDAADAEAICEAMSRPTMRFVPVKSAEQQAMLMLLKVRDLLVKQRTLLTNARHGHAAEFGGGLLVILDTTVTPALEAEGTAREVVRRLNDLRKKKGLRVEDRVRVRWAASGSARAAIETWKAWVADEVLAVVFDRVEPASDLEPLEVPGHDVAAAVERA